MLGDAEMVETDSLVHIDGSAVALTPLRHIGLAEAGSLNGSCDGLDGTATWQAVSLPDQGQGRRSHRDGQPEKLGDTRLDEFVHCERPP